LVILPEKNRVKTRPANQGSKVMCVVISIRGLILSARYPTA
jgi:hypothetical protein